MTTGASSGEAYIQLPSEEEVAAARPPDHPYNFGFVTGMSRLLMAHPRLGPPFQALFSEIMFAPDSELSRQEREMIAAVAASAQTCFY